MKEKIAKPSIILVLGMHRSGTSLIAQLISRWGAYMGDELYGANEYNKDGYWEYIPLVQLNEKILKHLGRSWIYPPGSLDTEDLITRFGKEAQELVEKMDSSMNHWCWKDPRMVFLLPFWKEIFSKRNLIYIVTARNPLAIAKSLKKREEISSTLALSLWECTTRTLADELAGVEKRIVVEYESIISDQKTNCEKLFKFLNKQTNEEKGFDQFTYMLDAIKPLLQTASVDNDRLKEDLSHLYDLYRKEDFKTIIRDANKLYFDPCVVLKYFYESNRNSGFLYQVYFLTEEESFIESKSILKKYHNDIKEVNINLKHLENLKKIRFDPLNDWVVLKIDEIVLKTEESIHENIGFTSNAFDNNSNVLIFNNEDPQILIDLVPFEGSKFEEITIFLNYVATGIRAKAYFSDILEDQLNEVFDLMEITQPSVLTKNTLIESINEKCSLLNFKIEFIQNQNLKKEQEITTKNRIIVDLKSINENFLSTIESQKETVSLIENEKNDIKELLKKSIDQNNSLQQNLTGLIDTNDQKSRNIELLRFELLEKDSQIQKLQKDLNAITNSRKWKYKRFFDFLKRKLFVTIQLLKLVVKTGWFAVSMQRGRFRKMLRHLKNIYIIKKSGQFDFTYYFENYPDVAAKKLNGIVHYVEHGVFEGRNPREDFVTNAYLQNYPDVAKSGLNPFVHYIKYGQEENRLIYMEPDLEVSGNSENLVVQSSGLHVIKIDESMTDRQINDFQKEVWQIRESGLFDNDYYYSEYPDVKNAGIEALEHYCLFGWKEGRNPNATFETNYYLSLHKDVKEMDINPLLHYITFGRKQKRKTQFADLTNESEGIFENREPYALEKTKLPVQTVAFYLPQFHPIPENDMWWGKNFTEWTNVTRAKPQFEGHYQPHLPFDLGFYDLRIPDVMYQQIDIAKSFGITGFCFYYYWFGGKRLLEKPLDLFLEHKDWDFNFCLCWANENWTRRWDGRENDILIAQQHSPEDDIAFINDIYKYITDSRYIKIEGKPLVIIYQPQIFPDIKATVKRWREFAKNNFNTDLYLTMVQTFGKYDPTEFDFDAAIEFPPHNVVPEIIRNIKTTPEFIGTIHNAKSLVNASKSKLSKVNYELFRGVMLNWDNTARKGRKSNIFINNTPITYKEWFEDAIGDTLISKIDNSKRIVFINAWNEWAEGTHLEPDQKYGYAYLNATGRALEVLSPVKNKLKIGVLIHAYYLDVLPELLEYLKNIDEKYTILLSVRKGNKDEAYSILKTHNYNDFIIKEVENIGFDIAPMFCLFQSEIFKYDLICKIHTKKSTHNNKEFGIGWRKFCMNYILKDKQSVRKIINEFNIKNDLGIVYPPEYPPVLDWIKKNGANLEQLKKILPESLVPDSYNSILWPMGSFFWFRPSALKPIFEENFTLQDFKPNNFSLLDESGIARDLTLAHSIERVFCYVARSNGYKTYKIENTLFDDKLSFPKVYYKNGFCPVCNAETYFHSKDEWFRDYLQCRNCKSLPRNRAIFNVLDTIDKEWKTKKIHESSPGNTFFDDVVTDYSYSQYYPDKKPGKRINGNRNENLERLTFRDNEFDYFITVDVLEHVFNPDIAINEMLRVVKKDGAVVFTVPVHKHFEKSVRRAKLDRNNNIIHLLPESYHGNPVGDGKSLVTWDYGKDLKNLVREWIGEYHDLNVFNESDEKLGIVGDYLDVFVIHKFK